ncbi:MAG TPA: M48 family metalloprotease [Vicinamibacterales bacterium]|nr:M48 family metalloprotease [Vicinamibacterales bacterium]
MTVRLRAAASVALLVAAISGAVGQTRITPPRNKYTPEQDVQLGREAAAEVRREYPIIENPTVTRYLDRLGRQLVEAAPAEFDHPAFEYSFTPVNLKEINAFALPGGPMFVNRGMFEAAATEGEVVGVMAHELSHVLLRHGTANATKAQGFQLGQLAGAIAGAVVGGGWGQVISQGSQFGLGTWLLKYSREYERQADLLGAQIMARAGYDPRDLGRMFETIQKSSRTGAPEWMSSHPDPGNRSSYIAREAASLQIAQRNGPSAEFDRARSAFASLPPAQSMAELARRSESGGGSTGAPANTGRIGDPVPPPSTQFRAVRGGQLFDVEVPANWTGISGNNAVKFVPENGYGTLNGQTVLTHGVEFGVTRASSSDLAEATRTLLTAFQRENPELRQLGEARRIRLSQREALGVPLRNRSATGRAEQIGLHTMLLSNGSLFYFATVVPQDDASAYDAAFARVARSLRLKDTR